MSGKPYQSSLIPHEEEIIALRQQRPPMPYAQIAAVLREKHGLVIQRAAIFKFVKVRSRRRKVYGYLRAITEKKTASSTTAAPGPSGSRHSATRPATTNQSAPTRPQAKPSQVPSRAPTSPGDFIPLKRDQPATVRRRLKTFTPSAEYNLERLTPEQMESFLKELDEELNASKGG